MKNNFFDKKLSLTIIFLAFIATSQYTLAQSVGINTTGANPDTSAILDIASSDKGLLIPRMDSLSRENIANPAPGLLVFDNTANEFMYYNGMAWSQVNGMADTLGNHIAHQNIQMNGHWLSGDGDAEGVYVDNNGNVGIKAPPTAKFDIHTGTHIGISVTDSTVMMNRVFYPLTDGVANQFLKIAEVDTANNWARAEWAYMDADHQDLTLIADTLWLGNSNSFADLSGLRDNTDHQDLMLTGTVLSITNSLDTVDLASYVNNTDAQILSLVNDTLRLTNAPDLNLGTVTFDDKQDLSITNHQLSLSSDPTAIPYDLTYLIDNDIMGNHIAAKNIQMNNHWLTNDGDNEGIQVDSSGRVGLGTSTPMAKFHLDMGPGKPGFKVDDTGITFNEYTFPLTDGTANQMLTTDGMGNLTWKDQIITDSQQISISGDSLHIDNGASISLTPLYDNTDQQDLALSGNLLVATNAVPLDLSVYANTDHQQLSLINDSLGVSNHASKVYLGDYKQELSFSNDSLSLSHDNTPLYLGDYKQGLFLNDDTLTISNYDSPIDLKGYLQSISLSGHTLSPGNGGTTADLSPYINTDDQAISIAGDWLTITGLAGGNSLNLGLYEIPDNQQLTLSNDSLFLTNDATGVDLSKYYDADSMGTSMALQHVKLNGNFISSDGDALEGIHVDAAGQVGIGTVPAETFHVKMANFTDGLQVKASGVGIGRIPVTNLLEVNGEASKSTTGAWVANSDARLKKKLELLTPEETLHKMLSLQGISYQWDDDKTGINRPEGIQYGFTAQNIQEQFPSLVMEDNMGYLQTSYGSLDAMKVESLRALNDKIETLKEEKERLLAQWQKQEAQLVKMAALNKRLEEMAQLKARVNELKAQLDRQ